MKKTGHIAGGFSHGSNPSSCSNRRRQDQLSQGGMETQQGSGGPSEPPYHMQRDVSFLSKSDMLPREKTKVYRKEDEKTQQRQKS